MEENNHSWDWISYLIVAGIIWWGVSTFILKPSQNNNLPSASPYPTFTPFPTPTPIPFQEQRKLDLQACLDKADLLYTSNWDGECAINGINKKTSGCTLPLWDANSQNDRRQTDKDNCFKQFPQN